MAKDRITDVGAFTDQSKRTADRNFADVSFITAQVDVTSSTVLVDATGMTTDAFTLVAGKTYRFAVTLITAAGGTGGFKVAFKQNNGLTLTSLNCTATGLVAAASATQLSTSTTDAASLFTQAAAVISCKLEGNFVVTTAGTLQVQFAQNTSNGTPTSILLGSRMEITQVGA